MVRVMLVVIVAISLLLASHVASVPPPDMGDDDAGSGGDAGDRPELAVPVEEGTHTGRVGWDVRHSDEDETTGSSGSFWWEYDPEDWYRFDVPSNVTVRATVSVPEDAFGNDTSIRILLRAPNGRSMLEFFGGPNRSTNPSRSGNVSAVAVRPGPWSLSVKDDLSPGPVPYKFRISFDRFDHGLVLDGGGARIAAWEVAFPEGVRGRMDRWLDPALYEDGMGDQQLYGVTFEPAPSSGRCGFAVRASRSGTVEERTGRTGIDGDTVAWTKGVLEESVSSPVDASGQLPVKDGWSWGFGTEVPVGNVTVRFGVAYQHGVDEAGYLVWDGPTPPVVDRKQATAEFLTLEDFEADDEGGFGAQVGPAAYAENLHVLRTVKDRPGNVIRVDATRPHLHEWFDVVGPTPYVPLGLRAPIIDVSLPNGSTQRVHDDWFFWEPLPRSFPWRGDQHVPPGTWRFDLDHIDGLEGDQVRVMLLSFGFPFDCA